MRIIAATVCVLLGISSAASAGMGKGYASTLTDVEILSCKKGNTKDGGLELILKTKILATREIYHRYYSRTSDEDRIEPWRILTIPKQWIFHYRHRLDLDANLKPLSCDQLPVAK